MAKRVIRTFKKHGTIKGAVVPKHNIRCGDEVTLHGQGNPKGVVVKVDRSLYHGGKGSVWYGVRLRNGRVITRRAWDFKEVRRG